MTVPNLTFSACLSPGVYSSGQVVGMDSDPACPCDRTALSASNSTIGGFVTIDVTVPEGDRQLWPIGEGYVRVLNDSESPLTYTEIGRDNAASIYWLDGFTMTRDAVRGMFLVARENRPISLEADGSMWCWVGAPQ